MTPAKSLATYSSVGPEATLTPAFTILPSYSNQIQTPHVDPNQSYAAHIVRQN